MIHKIIKPWEMYFLEVIRNERKGIVPSCLRGILHALSWPYKAIVTLRNHAFDGGWLRRYYPPVPVVISVGNLVAGGTGKTPVTLMIAHEFYKDWRLAILSRGYRAEAEKLRTPVILCNGEGPLHPTSYCGDEPYLLAQNLPESLVIVGRNRRKASDMAAQAGADLIILDDGMQHRRLARDFEVVVVDACDPFGHGHFIPRGFLRENIESLSRANLIILNHIHDRERYAFMRKEIEKYSAAPVVATRMEVNKIFDFEDKKISTLKDRHVGIFCGIAHPEYFRRTVQEQGALVLAHSYNPDHVGFDQNSLVAFANECKERGADLLVCTEKDKVRFDPSIDLPLPVAWIQAKLAIVEGGHEWKSFIKEAKFNLSRKM